jgi:hypothetical protein
MFESFITMTGQKKYFKIQLAVHSDNRGQLVAWENDDLPFNPQRIFIISNVPKGKERANHSVSSDLLITAISGSVKINLDKYQTLELFDKSESLYVKKDTFIRLFDFTSDAIVLVLAEKKYIQTKYKN